MRIFRALLLVAACAGQAHASSIPDRGIFPDLTPSVETRIPAWLRGGAPALAVDGKRQLATLYLDGLPVKVYAAPASTLSAADRAEVDTFGSPAPPPKATRDADADGIPDALDVLWGARKTALNGDAYTEGYIRIPYPGGDVPRHLGVCTDVVVRALRNAGFDLQRLVHRDMNAHPARYGLKDGERPDANIEHRRVRRLIRYFQAHHVALPAAFDAALRGRDAWLPGDIVFMDTFPDRAGPDHVGIVSDAVNAQGQPLIINNWTNGFTTRDMDLVPAIPITHRFRVGLSR